MKISVYNQQADYKIASAFVKKLARFVLEEKKVACQEIAIHLVTRQKIGKLHGQFFGDPTPTDCISFPIDDEFLGELFVCPKAALEYNAKNPRRETSLYIIHGILHLLGYDDQKPRLRAQMHREQNRLLKKWETLY